MRPPGQKDKPVPTPSQAQIDIMRIGVEAASRITASMITVTQEKNPAKIGEAFKTIYKALQEAIKAP